MSDTELVNRLVDALGKHVQPTIPIDVALWDVAKVAQYLNRDAAVVRERITCLPDFPKAIRLPAKQGRAHPLYKAKEVIAWTETYREKR